MKTKPILIACVVALATSAVFAREPKESGEKGGTGDINIGVGELQKKKGALATPGGQKAPLLPPAVQSARETAPKNTKKQHDPRRRKGNVEQEFKVEEGK